MQDLIGRDKLRMFIVSSLEDLIPDVSRWQLAECVRNTIVLDTKSNIATLLFRLFYLL